MAQLKKTMFREYDIRGRESDDELNEQSVYTIVRAFAKTLRDAGVTECIAGHDARHTSEIFHAAAIRALTESGVNVVDIGNVTTPMGHWAQFHFNVKGFCVITASHNPVGWNGLKLGSNEKQTYGPDDLQKVRAITETEEWTEGAGTVRKEDIAEGYIKDLLSRVSFKKKLKVLVNTGNGTAGLFAPALFKGTGHEIVEHLTNLDPSYPNYTANPAGERMMDDTGAQVRKHGCDIGIAIDGDGDRLGITDEKGTVVWPDRYLMLLSRLILEKDPGAKIVFDVKVSEALPDDIKAHGGIPIMCKTGHWYVKNKIAEEKAAFGGEMTGHIFISDGYYGYDDALFAGLKMLEYLAEQSEPLSEIVAKTPYYVSTPVYHVKTTDEEKYQIVDELVQMFKDDGHKVVDINGGRVYIKDGWGLVRASSNEPVLVLRFEAKTEETVEHIKNIFKEKLSKFKNVGTEWDSSGH
jgi:phosphomannomutase/phosphoglucomutase